MKSADGRKKYLSTKEIAWAARRREGIGAILKAALEAWAGPGLLVLLLVASLVYVAFGGAFPAPSAFQLETPVAAISVEAADTGDALRTATTSAGLQAQKR